MSARSIGLQGEQAAESRLRDDGLEIIARGFRARGGEIDLIARDGPVVVFVEVKTRSGSAYRPAEAVDARKRRRIARAAALFLLRAGWTEAVCRFDVVEVTPKPRGFEITRIADAFRLGD